MLLIQYIIKTSKNNSLNRTNKYKKQISISITVISITVFFILFTSPGAVTSVYFSILIQTFAGKIVILLCDGLSFSYHALNILILCFTNKRFYTQLKCLFLEEKSNQAKKNFKTNTVGTISTL